MEKKLMARRNMPTGTTKKYKKYGTTSIQQMKIPNHGKNNNPYTFYCVNSKEQWRVELRSEAPPRDHSKHFRGSGVLAETDSPKSEIHF